MKMRSLVLLACFLTVGSAHGQNGRRQVEEGNKLYAEEKYDEANNKYRDALIDSPESPVVNFNIGDVLYKKRNFEEAVKSFEKATNADDLMLQSKSYYNLGNTLYKMGKMPESILMYKKALELNPNDEDAKFNLEYVRAKLKDQAQEQSQQNQDQQQQQEQNQQQQQGQQNQEGQQQQQQEQEQQEQNQSENQENQDQQQQDEQQQQAAEAQEISKEDAERILNALEKDEQDLLQKQKGKKAGRAYRGKDW